MPVPQSMRERADLERVRRFLKELGRAAPAGSRAYLVGGATALLEGWRETTVDVDLRLEPDHDALLRSIAELKERLDVNVELAAPPDFIPELPGWRDRSPFVMREGLLDVHHFDFYSQALSKIERGFVQDLDDVSEMVRGGRVEPRRALDLFDAIYPEMFRYPAIDPDAFRAKVHAILGPSIN